MKQKILSLMFILMSIFISCDKDDVSKLCIAPNGGIIKASEINLTALVPYSPSISSITLIKGSEEFELIGIIPDAFSNWQTIPFSGSINVVFNTIDDMILEFDDVLFPNETELSLILSTVNDELVLNVQKYSYECNDTPN